MRKWSDCQSLKDCLSLAHLVLQYTDIAPFIELVYYTDFPKINHYWYVHFQGDLSVIFLSIVYKFSERIKDLRVRLQEEETASKNIKRLPML